MAQHLEHHHEEPDAWHSHAPEEGMPQPEHAARVSPLALGVVLGGLAAVTVAMVVLVIVYFKYVERRTLETRVETVDLFDQYAAQRDAEIAGLQTYRWLDADRSAVQLPIDRAMELMLEEHGSESHSTR